MRMEWNLHIFFRKRNPAMQVLAGNSSCAAYRGTRARLLVALPFRCKPALEMTMGRTPNDDRSDSMNPNNDAYDDANDNHSNQLNPNNERYQGGLDNTED